MSPDILSAELTEGNAETDADQNTSDMLPELVQNEENLSQHSILIMSLKTGGLGLNLTAANHVIHIDRWWNPAVENQATDRAHRIGQKQTVYVYKFIASGTLEEHIDQMLEQKKALSDLLIDSGESWLTELSTQQLKTILELRNDVIDNDTCLN